MSVIINFYKLEVVKRRAKYGLYIWSNRRRKKSSYKSALRRLKGKLNSLRSKERAIDMTDLDLANSINKAANKGQCELSKLISGKDFAGKYIAQETALTRFLLTRSNVEKYYETAIFLAAFKKTSNWSEEVSTCYRQLKRLLHQVDVGDVIKYMLYNQGKLETGNAKN